MSAETAIRDTLEELDRVFPGVGMLNKTQTALFLGVNRSVVYRMARTGRLTFNGLGRVTKTALARQLAAGECGEEKKG